MVGRLLRNDIYVLAAYVRMDLPKIKGKTAIPRIAQCIVEEPALVSRPANQRD